MCPLQRTTILSPKDVHIIGHSLGAEVAAFVGQLHNPTKFGNLGRISGEFISLIIPQTLQLFNDRRQIGAEIKENIFNTKNNVFIFIYLKNK